MTEVYVRHIAHNRRTGQCGVVAKHDVVNGKLTVLFPGGKPRKRPWNACDCDIRQIEGQGFAPCSFRVVRQAS